MEALVCQHLTAARVAEGLAVAWITVIVDLTPMPWRSRLARLLDMVEGRSKHVFKQWLAARPQYWRDRVQVGAMDGFTGFKTAAAEVLPEAVAVKDPFYADLTARLPPPPAPNPATSA